MGRVYSKWESPSGKPIQEPMGTIPECDIVRWMAQQMNSSDHAWLVSELDDGLIWGYVSNGDIHTSKNSPLLRIETIQRARIFNGNFELKIWRDGSALKAMKIMQEGEPSNNHAVRCEKYPLLGARAEFGGGDFDLNDIEGSFSELMGIAGERQLVPIPRSGVLFPYLNVAKHYLWKYEKSVMEVHENFHAGWSLCMTRWTGISFEKEGM